MTAAVATMPSSTTSHTTTDSHQTGRTSEAGPRGFTAVNGETPHSTPPTSRETSPRYSASGVEVSPVQNGMAGHGSDPGSHKRKRSGSSEHLEPSPSRRYDYNPPKRSETHQHMADKALHELDKSNVGAPNSYYSTTPNGTSPSGYTYDRPYNGGNHVSHANQTEDGYQHESSHHHNRYPSQSEGPEGEGQDQQGEDGGRAPILPIGGKRKRNFSNRTKTGCLTCRQRKKKCDEARPTCNNCTRGGFACLGYNNTRPGNWPKPATTKPPIPLQSKDTDDQHSTRADSDTTPVSANPSHHDTAHFRATSTERLEQTRPAYLPHSQMADGRPSYTAQQQQQPQQWPQHTPSQHNQPPQSYNSDQLPPFSELARSDPQRPDYSHPPSREMSRPNTQPASATSQAPPNTHAQWQHSAATPTSAHPQSATSTSDYRHPPYAPPRIETQQTQAPPPPARMSSGTYNPGSKVFSKEEVERSRMLRMAPYNYFDATLKNERQRCAQALERYNNACRLGSGISESEAKAMLNKVFDPSLDKSHSFLAPCQEKGFLAPGVIIEGSFRCTYGYNIRVSDNVFIGEGTRIDDSAKVDIGARTWIGANVTILTNDVCKEMVQRKGTDGQKCISRPVIISSEVVIGEGAKIYPGVTIGRGATVEPWAIVMNNLPENMAQKAHIGPRAGGDPNAVLGWDRP